MENKYNLQIKSEILEKQAQYLFTKAREKLGETASETEVSALVAETIRRYYTNLGRPLLIQRQAESGHLPFIEEYNQMIDEITEDISILFGEIQKIGDYLAHIFDYSQTEKTRLQNKIRGLNGLVNDLNLIANDSSGNAVYFRESFNDANGMDASMVMGLPCHISTNEGILTLAHKGVVNRSQKATIRSIQGNGEKGTYHIARRIKVESPDGGGSTTVITYLSEQVPNDNPSVILDGRPDTIFEYQMVNCEEDDIVNIAKGYDFEWAKGKKHNDKLRLKIVIELEQAVDINWISINPYHPPYSTGKVTVYSIRTSEDGFEYKGLYEGGNYVLNSELNTTPQTYRLDAIFDGKNDFTASKFAGQGVWSFPTRKAKYVEIVLDQTESYEELIGHTYYEKVRRATDTNGNEVETRIRIKSSDVADWILDAPPGTYPVDYDTEIVKAVEAFNGWRYVIGLRDINIMSYEFEEMSEFVSKRYETNKPIQEVMLYASEKIPESYLNVVSTANDWIQYFVSFDDLNWHRISPMHHQPVSKDGFPPKIIQINGNKTELESAFQLYKTYLEMDHPVTGVRLKVVMKRPKDIENSSATTPILEDYALRVVFADKIE